MAATANGSTEMKNGEAPATPTPPAGPVGPPASPIPQWIQANIFQEVLKEEVPGFLQIKDFKIVKAMGAGENYATLMLRIQAELELTEGKTKSIAFMMKVPHNIEFMRKMREVHNIFDVEKGMYFDIVPELEALYRSAGLELRFGAKPFILKDAKDDYILLEDLSNRGFKNANRLEGLDMEHTRCVLKKMAQWHAASACRIASKGPYDKIYSCGFFVEGNDDVMKEMFELMSSVFLKCLTTYEGHEVYLEDVKKLIKHQPDEVKKLGKVDPNEFNVLNHGDCWSNNVMFQYDAFGKIKETYLVDYQIPRYGSPAQDLFYFLLSSAKLELKMKQFDYFIKYYHDELVTHLQLLKYPKKIPKLREIHLMLYKYGLWGYITATGVMSAVLLDPTDKASLENFLTDEGNDGNNFKMMLYSNTRYRKHVEQVLPWLQNRGAMEC